MGNKIIGIIGIVFGLGVFAPLVVLDNIQIAISEAGFFPLRYFKVILGIIGGSYFVAFGALTYTGFLSPYFSADRFEKAKLNVFSGLFSIPILLLLIISMLSLTVNSRLEGLWLIILWFGLAVLIMVFVWGFFSGIKILRERALVEKGV